MELDEIAVRNSTWAWNRLREARKLDFQIGEESLTDFIILNLKKWGSGKIAVNTFTRHAESLNGADWEWWFTGPSGRWLGMRVQAKVLNLASEKYEHLHHKNKNGAQVDLLISDAKRKGLVPLYCMFTNWDPKKYKVIWTCLSHKSTVRHFGTSILSPHTVKRLQSSNETRLSSLINSLRPMHCIFCCSGFGGVELPERALNWLQGADILQAIEEERDKNEVEYVRDEAPFYVHQLLEGSVEENFVDLQDDRLKRITVFRELDSDPPHNQ
jgi:hypothetical protein